LAQLEVDEVSLNFGGVRALDALTFDVEQGEICALIGPNGAGKTTMFNVISRVYRPTAGRLRFEGADLLGRSAHDMAVLGIARTFQNLALFPSLTVLENVMVGAHADGEVGFGRAMLRLGVRSDEKQLAAQAWSVLERLGLADVAHHPAAGLPYGTLKRIEIARALAGDARLLLLDEPASGLNHSEVDELAAAIRDIREDFGLTMLLVEHHMAMVMGISDKVVVIESGQKISEGPPSEVRNDKRVISAYLGTEST
jgi:branched-chain amino acid transport system ATP-binding protein